MKIASLLPSLLLLAGLASGQQLQKLDMHFEWQRPPVPYEVAFNIRYLAAGSVVADYHTWPILTTVTNSTSHWMFYVWETQLFAITQTNYITGVESIDGIGPVNVTYYYTTNGPSGGSNKLDVQPPDLRDVKDVADPNATKQSLQFWWNGPPSWQSNGAIFNVRCATNGSPPVDTLTWPLFAMVTNILNVKFYNVNPTQYYAISFTNKWTGVEDGEGIGPIRGQYNWQGVTNLMALESDAPH